MQTTTPNSQHVLHLQADITHLHEALMHSDPKQLLPKLGFYF